MVKAIVFPDKKSLLWTLCWVITLGAVLFFWLMDLLSDQTEQQLSYISQAHQQELHSFGRDAEAVYQRRGEGGLAEWLITFQQQEATWAAVIRSNFQPVMGGGALSEQFKTGLRLGRDPSWKIHLYFEKNPIMEVPFLDDEMHLLIQLPQRMRPGSILPYTRLLFQMVFPLLLALLISLLIYRHIMVPLRQLEKTTRQFSDGQFDVRLAAHFGSKSKELSALANTFDRMAERTERLIVSQRQLLADLSHEIRTPLARMDMAISCVENGIHAQESVARLHAESAIIRCLVEDALTLVWFNNEDPSLRSETIDLVELLRVIVDDARFEYSDRTLSVDLPMSAMLDQTSHRALGQAIENVLRNALKYTGKGGTVVLSVGVDEHEYRIRLQDQGPGVPEWLLDSIFKPFFRVEKQSGASQNGVQSGFGLGLALAQRQVLAVGGQIKARNRYAKGKVMGLEVLIQLPRALVMEK